MTDEEKILQAVIAEIRLTIRQGYCWSPSIKQLEILANALEKTLPKTRTVQRWHVEYACKMAGEWRSNISDICKSEDEARKKARYRETDRLLKCVRVTGPHSHELPE